MRFQSGVKLKVKVRILSYFLIQLLTSNLSRSYQSFYFYQA